ncbi:hypothetical protein MRB53_038449 [Persea americana]|nr:hypothetical protein MRB53_038449 [Persea americana]
MANFHKIESYPWSSDEEFQSGLSAILGPDHSTSQTTTQSDDLAVRARCFYYARKYDEQVDFDEYKAWRASQPAYALTPLLAAATPAVSSPSISHTTTHRPEATADVEAQAEPPKASFAEIMELIESGKPVPGIRTIPDTVLTGQGTEAKQVRRQKPWEQKATAGTVGITSMTAGSA